ncbi:50S ribosomal protein L11 methyltransferase [Leptolyngbya sp. AN02str]|uniref:50S ribosomal protein L11 methyltransferase n=1 Tax=Leptolyngbya sp. AN02str TaxID=3423363 RepID=UPI003D3197F8
MRNGTVGRSPFCRNVYGEPMAWIELTLHTTAEAVDWIRTLLAAHDQSLDVHITGGDRSCNDTAAQALDAATEDAESEPWPIMARLYVPDTLNARSTVQTLESILSPLYRTGQTSELEVMRVAELPTATPADHLEINPEIYIGDRFVIQSHPTKPVSTDAIVLYLAPSLAFGSGLHPATALSLRLIERYIQRGMKTLDLGCGSGILSLAMAKLGAMVLALDNDGVAVQATQEAVQVNQLTESVTVMAGSLGQGSSLGHWMGGTPQANLACVEDAGEFTAIAANLLGRIHVALAADYYQALRPQGMLLTAGFDVNYEPEVTAALETVGFAVIDRLQSEDWVALVYQRPA